MNLLVLKLFWLNLSFKHKRSFIFLFIIVLVGTFAEMLSIGIIIPAFSIIFEGPNTNMINNNFIGELKYNYSKIDLIFFISLLLIFIFFMKSVLLTYIYMLQTKFCYGVQENITNKLFKKYLFSTIIINNKRKSAELIRNLTSETDQMVNYFLLPFLNFFVEIFVFISIVLVLFYFEFKISIIIFLFSFFSILIFFLVTKKQIKNISSERQIYEEKKIKTIQDAFASIRDLVILRCRNISYNYFAKQTGIVSVSKRKIEFLNYLPKIWIEFLGVLLIVVIVFFMIYWGKNLNSFLPTLALFAVAAFRILPITNRLLISLQNIKYGQPIIKNIIENLNEKIKDDYTKSEFIDKNNSFELKSITLKKIAFKFNPNDKFLFKDVNLEIKKGDKIAIIGESGSGKSTFIDLLIGFLKPTQGQILINNDLYKSNLLSIASNIGYVPQNVYILDRSIQENIALNTININSIKIEDLSKICLLDNILNKLEKNNISKLGERGSILSGGQKQRIAIARALYQNPKILILDEATNALDEKMEEKLINNILNYKKIETIIIVNHRISSLKKCNKFFTIQNNEITQSSII